MNNNNNIKCENFTSSIEPPVCSCNLAKSANSCSNSSTDIKASSSDTDIPLDSLDSRQMHNIIITT